MNLLKKDLPKDMILENKKIFKRVTARGVIINNDKILLLHIKAHNDYSLPGGGVEDGEELTTGLIREIEEETGAKNIKVISEFGVYDEFFNSSKSEFDIINIISYVYVCSSNIDLNPPKLEDYEIELGLKAVWIDIDDAITHNEKIQNIKPHYMSRYLKRELFLLKAIRKELYKR